MDNFLFAVVSVVALAIGTASGVVGSFLVLRRMSLVGDALSHVALPGIALALAYGVDPFWGVLVSLLFAALFVWKLEEKTTVPPEALIGVLFTASLAIGVLVIPDHEIIESLFGAFPLLSVKSGILVFALSSLSLLLSLVMTQEFVFLSVSRDLAQVNGVSRWHRLLLLVLFSFSIALGIKLVGTLLMGALAILPASSAKNVARSIKEYILLSGVFGGFMALAGSVFAYGVEREPGPFVILIGVLLFAFTYAWRILFKIGA